VAEPEVLCLILKRRVRPHQPQSQRGLHYQDHQQAKSVAMPPVAAAKLASGSRTPRGCRVGPCRNRLHQN
jgi:hypothetical protein